MAQNNIWIKINTLKNIKIIKKRIINKFIKSLLSIYIKRNYICCRSLIYNDTIIIKIKLRISRFINKKIRILKIIIIREIKNCRFKNYR